LPAVVTCLQLEQRQLELADFVYVRSMIEQHVAKRAPNKKWKGEPRGTSSEN